MIVFGIDPGVSGAISVFENKKIINFFDMPTQIEGTKNKKRQVNAIQLTYEIKSRIANIEKSAAIVEMVNAMPNQGVTSMFNFGQSYGVIKGIFLALEIPTFFVRPAKWKKIF
jgi:crossover junction endodeoxyribonuclease RuvC